MSQRDYDDLLVYSRAERFPESFHNPEDEVPLQDLRVVLQTLEYDCETWVNEERRLCIQFHGLAEESWASRCVGGELRLTIWNPHA